MKRTLLWTFFGMALLFAGCNTISGAGEDLEEVGETIEETAEDAKD